MNLLIVLSTIVFSVLFMSGFAVINAAHEKTAMASGLSWAENLFEKSTGESDQILLVVGDNPVSSSAKIYLFERYNSTWGLIHKSIDASIGGSGFAMPGKKREGDGRTPSGIYSLEFAFGYLPEIHTKMNYLQAKEDDIWVDDVDSIDYNRWVKRGQTKARSYEDLKRSDNLYKYAIVIGYNTDPVVRGLGSAIFLHVWRGKGKKTTGCVAMSEKDILIVLDWLDPSKKPLVVMGTEETLKGMAKK